MIEEQEIIRTENLTKIYETVERSSLREAAEKYREVKPRGEFVIIIERPEKAPPAQDEKTLEDAVRAAAELVAEGLSASEAAKRAAKQYGIKKGDIYRGLNSV